MTDALQGTRQCGPATSMPDDVFIAISRLAHREAGLMIPESKRTLVQSRISKRLRSLGLSDYRSYLELVTSGTGADELNQMISALTTNVSSFFRENHHFEALRAFSGELIDRARRGTPVRLWSAGCSSGQEPYSIGMTLLEQDGDAAKLDIRILATDIDTRILEFARRGEYSKSQMDGVADALRAKHFSEVDGGAFSVSPTLRKMVSFRPLNLLRPWPMKRKFDAVFCRNVVIYFDEPTQAELWPRFRQALGDGGMLFVGHSERVLEPEGVGLKPVGLTTYLAVGGGTRLRRDYGPGELSSGRNWT